MLPRKKKFTLAILALVFFQGCVSESSIEEGLLGLSQETFPIKKMGFFTRNHRFGSFQIEGIIRSKREKAVLGLKGSQLETWSRAVGFTLKDAAGYHWDVLALVKQEWVHLAEKKRKVQQLVSYTLRSRMKEKKTDAVYRLLAYYSPADPAFDTILHGSILSESDELLYTFQSNARLDSYDSPHEGLRVISFYQGENPIAVFDRRQKNAVTFFKGLQPGDRTRLAACLASLFALTRYGTL